MVVSFELDSTWDNEHEIKVKRRAVIVGSETGGRETAASGKN